MFFQPSAFFQPRLLPFHRRFLTTVFLLQPPFDGGDSFFFPLPFGGWTKNGPKDEMGRLARTNLGSNHPPSFCVIVVFFFGRGHFCSFHFFGTRCDLRSGSGPALGRPWWGRRFPAAFFPASELAPPGVLQQCPGEWVFKSRISSVGVWVTASPPSGEGCAMGQPSPVEDRVE